MKKGLIALLLSGFLASCSIPCELPKQEKLILLGLSDDGIVIVRDTNSDGKLDQKFYYRLIGIQHKEGEFLYSDRYFIFKYLRSEAYSPGLDLDFPDVNLHSDVVLRGKF